MRVEDAGAALRDAVPADVVQICRRLKERGKRGWIVGGCVRDVLSGRAAKDWDIATDALPEQVQRMFRKVIPTGLQHGTVTVLLHGEPYEVTTFRGEGAYSDGRRPDEVHFLTEIEGDLARRDFTFNAIAFDPLSQELVDPFGGIDDLQRRLVRAVGIALERFTEDGLRILRAARFSATLECDIDDDTRTAMGAPAALATFRQVSAERIHDEWLKTMKAARPSIAFASLQRCGVVAVISPQLEATVHCRVDDADERRAQLPDDEGMWLQRLRAIDACPADPVLRITTLLRHLACAEHPQEPFSAAAIATTLKHAEALLRRLKFSNERRQRTLACLALPLTPELLQTSRGWSDAEVRRWIRRVGESRLADVLLLADVERRASARLEDGPMAQALKQLGERAIQLLPDTALSARDLALDGRKLMRELDLKPGRVVGELLAQLLERVTDEPQLNQPALLLEQARTLLAERAEDNA